MDCIVLCTADTIVQCLYLNQIFLLFGCNVFPFSKKHKLRLVLFLKLNWCPSLNKFEQYCFNNLNKTFKSNSSPYLYVYICILSLEFLHVSFYFYEFKYANPDAFDIKSKLKLNKRRTTNVRFCKLIQSQIRTTSLWIIKEIKIVASSKSKRSANWPPTQKNGSTQGCQVLVAEKWQTLF